MMLLCCPFLSQLLKPAGYFEMLKNSLPLGGRSMWLGPPLGYSSSTFSFTLDSVCDSLCLHFPMISERTLSWVQLSGRFPNAFFPWARAMYILSVLQLPYFSANCCSIVLSFFLPEIIVVLIVSLLEGHRGHSIVVVGFSFRFDDGTINHVFR